MKRISTVFAAAGLLALGACGGATDDAAINNVVAVDGGDALYNVAPDDLGGNYLGNESYGNETGAGNGASNAPGNAAANGL